MTPSVEQWVDLELASTRLVDLWNIPLSVAEDIVRNTAKSGKAQLRAIARFDSVFQFVMFDQLNLTRTLPHSPDWDRIEISWADLIKYGRNIAPNWVHVADDELIDDQDQVALKNASEHEIRTAMHATYNEAELACEKPPNVKELAALVKTRLSKDGQYASGRRIQKLAEEPAFKARRWKPGTTRDAQLRRQQK